MRDVVNVGVSELHPQWVANCKPSLDGTGPADQRRVSWMASPTAVLPTECGAAQTPWRFNRKLKLLLSCDRIPPVILRQRDSRGNHLGRQPS